jgi:hypothetical protein
MSDAQPAAVAAETAPVESSGEVVESLDTGSVPVESQADVIDQAEASGEITKKEAQSLKKQLKIKIDGQEQTVEYDPNDEESLKREFQKSRAFDKRAKEYATLKNTVEGFIQKLTSGDEAAEQALAELGMNPEEFAVKLMERKIKELEKSPEQIEREKMQKELEDLRSEKKRAEEEKQQMQMEKLRNQYAAEIENEIESGLNDAKSKLPKGNPRVVKRIAQTMLHAMENGYNDVTVRDVIPIVEKEWQEELRSYFDTSAEDLLEELVGKHNLDRVRKKRLGSRPNAPKANVNSIKDTGSSKIQEDVERPKKSLKSFLRDD